MTIKWYFFEDFFSGQPLTGHMQLKNSMYTYIKLLIYSVPFVTWSETCGHSHMFSEWTILCELKDICLFCCSIWGNGTTENKHRRNSISRVNPQPTKLGSICKWEKVYIGEILTNFKIINVGKNCQLLNTWYMKFSNRQCTTLILSHWVKIKLITCRFAKTFTMN